MVITNFIQLRLLNHGQLMVVLKHVSDLNQVVEIKDLPIVDGSSMYLKEGEAFTVKELLDALLNSLI